MDSELDIEFIDLSPRTWTNSTAGRYVGLKTMPRIKCYGFMEISDGFGRFGEKERNWMISRD